MTKENQLSFKQVMRTIKEANKREAVRVRRRMREVIKQLEEGGHNGKT